MEKRDVKILEDIKAVKIQGATNLAKSALQVYERNLDEKTKKLILSLRPTEPLLAHIVSNFNGNNKEQILAHLKKTQEKINKLVLPLIKNNSIIFTHCHSTSVVNALKFARKKGKKFTAYSTETRPLFQGRKTASELKKAGIDVLAFVDSAAAIALSGRQGLKKPDLVFLGADAILRNGVINKVGSGLFAHIASEQNIPVYILADSWKYSHSTLKLEERDFHEVWKNAPKHIKIKNLAFELISPSHIKAIVSELGILPFNKFLSKLK
ncbi:MAG: hypothetical protein AABX65_01905 [Nanoarchaeota archaeon]